MLASLFRSNRPAVLLLLLVLVPVLFLPGLWRTTVAQGLSMPLYELVTAPSANWSWWPGLLALLVIGLCAVQLTFLARDAELFEQRVHLPALLFPVMLAALDSGRVLEPALLGLPFVLATMARAWSIAQPGRVLVLLFDAGLLLGIAALFHLPYAVLLLVVWASCSVIRPFHWREYALPALGLAVPIYLAWAIHIFRGGGDMDLLATVLSGPEALARAPLMPPVLWWVSRIALGALLLVSLVVYAGGYQRGVMREKNLRASFMGFFFAMGLLALLLRLLEGSQPAVLVVAPGALFVTHALLIRRRAWLGELAVLLLLAAGLWTRWG